MGAKGGWAFCIPLPAAWDRAPFLLLSEQCFLRVRFKMTFTHFISR